MTRVFVYGTLKKGFPNHHVIEQAGGKFVGNGFIDSFIMFDLGGFPAILETYDGEDSTCYQSFYRHKNTPIIRGEVWEVDSLDKLDVLEGFPSMYYRRLTTVDLVDSESKYSWAWMYYMEWDQLPNGVKLIKSGEWEDDAGI